MSKKITSYFLSQALQQALMAFDNDEVPIGAVIVKDNIILSAAFNQMKVKKDATAHAEILCIRDACAKIGSQFLNDCSLYVTLEPCPMCACAIAHARIKRVYFGAYDPKGGGVCHGPEIYKYSLWRPEVIGGIKETECADLLKRFFELKR